MLEFNTVSFLLLVVLGAFVQTISGFALGLVIIVGATILKLELIAFSAAVISLISLVNSSVALRTSYRNIDRHYLTYLCIALLPGLFRTHYKTTGRYEIRRDRPLTETKGESK